MKHNCRPGADPFGLICALVIVSVMWGCISSYANAGHRRARIVCPPRVVKAVAHVAPYFQPSLAYYPAVQYMIGANLRQSAVEEYSYRDELQELRGYKHGVETAKSIAQAAIAQAQQLDESGYPLNQPVPPEAYANASQGRPTYESQPQGHLGDGQPAPAQAGPPPQPQQQMAGVNSMSPMAAPFAAKFPTIVQACGGCHRPGGKAQDYVRLNGELDVLNPAECNLREEILRRMISQDPKLQMPPPESKPLPPEAIEAIVLEMHGGGGP